MDLSNNIEPENCQTVLRLQSSDIIKFQNKVKTVVAIGPCQILALKNENETPKDLKVYYIRINNFCQDVKHYQTFVRIQYPTTTSYLFQNNENGINAISFNKEEPASEKFDALLSQFANVHQFGADSADPNLMERIKIVCPQNIQTEDISTDPKKRFKAVGKTLGRFVGTINGYLEGPTKSVGSALSQRADRISRESISQATKSKWSTIKQKSANFNEGVSNVLRPVVNGYYNLSDKVGEKFYASENFVIKAVRQYSLAFSKSLNEGEREVRQPVEVPEQSMKEEATMNNLK